MVLTRLQFFIKKNLLTLSKDGKYIHSSVENLAQEGIMDFGKQLVIPFVDTYLIVLLAVE